LIASVWRSRQALATPGRGLDPVPAFVDGLRAILVNGSAQEFGDNADAAIPANEGKT
jgi:hypothetical protein